LAPLVTLMKRKQYEQKAKEVLAHRRDHDAVGQRDAAEVERREQVYSHRRTLRR
jgi:hypothetical protein